MIANIARAGLLLAALAVAGCSESSVTDFVPQHANRQLPAKIVAEMKAKGMTRTSPVLARVFKEEAKLEVWKQKTNGRYDLIATYDICKMSGKLGPKFTEGDRQSPEGFYTVRPGQMNPNSSYHLAFNIGYPNSYDRANGRTGSNLMVHGACSSSGCFSMTDAQIEEIYAFARDAFKGGQTEFQVQSYPFRMTPANMARYRKDPNYQFWAMLKEGYDHFEITKVPPKVDVCEKRYVFNQIPEAGTAFNPTGACPAVTQPQALQTAYQAYKSKYDAAFASATGADIPAPKPTIAGLKEAAIVSDWTKRRARGERVTIEPPAMAQDGSIVQTTARMGRIDSAEGRRMAAADAAADAKKKAAEEKAQAVAAAKAAKLAAQQEVVTATVPQQQPVVTEAPTQAAQVAPVEEAGAATKLKKKLLGLFGS
ncbi:L,D-transpeptidase family protein [Aminobacter carboxidus]|uniref:Murein L,D-transpeptidase n=1 Tax=Aminobacter carboxidus TaxID=376165 RepID=A0ABR9GUK3_9HYPH|nr:murein L,D-transpeptidase family protein [Aminobacter carboxidus]MBE1207359.1 murein L,D-transpeptidase [Aminobacter carboxidus]